MAKPFDEWNETKKELNTRTSSKPLHFKQGEVWWCSVGVNVGHEVDGKGIKFQRPVLIVQVVNRETFLGVPISKQIKESGTYRTTFHISPGETRQALVSQVKLFDSARLTERMVKIPYSELEIIRKALKNIFS
jgi:mRNA interferase MazF